MYTRTDPRRPARRPAKTANVLIAWTAAVLILSTVSCNSASNRPTANGPARAPTPAAPSDVPRAGLAPLRPAGEAAEAPANRSRFALSFPAFAAEFRVLLYAPDEPAAKAAVAAAADRVAKLEPAFDPSRPDGDLARLHAAAGGPAVPVGPDLLLVLRKSREAARQSGGAYDPTAAGSAGNWQAVEVDPRGGAARLAAAGMRLDPADVARAYAADAALATLKERGAGSAAVQVGPHMVVGDRPPGQGGWRVRVATDRRVDGWDVLMLENAAVTTCDEPTAAGGVVTVVAPNALTAAPLARAACRLGPQGTPGLLDAYAGTQAYFGVLAGRATGATSPATAATTRP